MKIFYYYWGENPKDDMVSALKAAGHTVVMSDSFVNGYDNTHDAEILFDRQMSGETGDCAIFSFNYFPFLSHIAHKHGLPYISWVYDCPHLTLYSHTISYPENHIFIFDKKMCDTAISCGAVHIFHLPLAFSKRRMPDTSLCTDAYRYEVSFVGSLYDNNLFDRINYLPPYLSGYIDSLIGSQQKLWGINLSDLLLTDTIVSEMSKYIKLEEHPKYSYTDKEIFSDLITKKIANVERLRLLSGIKGLSLFTGSSIPEGCGLASLGTLDHDRELPAVFSASRINLNITLRSIESGIPLRAIDIMGCGGFLLSNYQPELDEYFTNNEEYVCYADEADMRDKIAYFLTHEDERKWIAANGRKKVFADFTYEKAISRMFDVLSL